MDIINTLSQTLSANLVPDNAKLTCIINDLATEVMELESLRSSLPAQFWTIFTQLMEISMAAHSDEPSRSDSKMFERALLRLIKNSSVSSARNQKSFCNAAGHLWIRELILHCDPEDECTIQLAVQSLCNMITGNAETQMIVLPTLLSSTDTKDGITLADYLISRKDSNSRLYLLLLLYNIVFSSPMNCRTMIENHGGRIFLRKCLELAESIPSGEDSETFDWVSRLIGKFIEHDFFALLARCLLQSENDSELALQLYHVTLLKFLDSYIYALSSANPPKLFIPSDSLQEFLSSAFTMFTSSIAESVASSRPFHSDAVIHSDSLILLLEIFGQLTLEAYPRDKLNRWFVQTGVLENTISLLGVLQKHQISRSKLSTASSDNELLSASTYASQPALLLKRDLIKLVAHLSYKNRLVQDQVRLLHGIPLILSNLIIDDLYPFIKEYAVLALRNLLDGNTDNQALIRELKPVGVSVETGQILEDYGLEGRIVDGQIKVKPIKKN